MSKNNTYYGVTSKTVATENFNVSITNHNAHSNIDLHAHDKPYLCLLVSGFYEEKSQKTDEIKEGQAIFRTKNYEHANAFNSKDSICLNIEINNENDFIERNGNGIVSESTNRRGSIACYRALYVLKSDSSKDVLDICCHEAILAHLVAGKTKGSLEWIKLVQEYIQDNPLVPISLNVLSEMFSIHPNYVVRKFKECTGYRLSEYLVKVRLERSLNDLINSKKSITDIALNSGFYDQSHFNRNFKSQLQATPSIYRKIIKG